MNRLSVRAWLPLVAITVLPSFAHGDVLVSGSATINYSKAAWDSLAGGNSTPGFEALILDEAFDQAAANARTSAQILGDEVQASPSYTGLTYALNGASVNNLSGRTTQPTTFGFTPGNLTGHTGAIGLGGITRWDVNPLLGGGQVLFGDFTLKYDAARVGGLIDGSGWHLVGNIAPAGVVFDLKNVSTSDSGNALSISGDLTISYEVANFLLATPSDQGKNMGSFALSAVTAVPEPTTTMLLLAGVLGLSVSAVKRRAANR